MIHYSDPWCRHVEGFAAPVVHGPLNLINKLDLWRDKHGTDGRMPTSITYRALAPLYAGSPYMIKFRGAPEIKGENKEQQLSVSSGEDTVNMRGNIVFR
jgi:hydroxyacyl-ACP dehydratase HTD2-like protein with hotdog domain